jgi:hypothetical protein
MTVTWKRSSPILAALLLAAIGVVLGGQPLAAAEPAAYELFEDQTAPAATLVIYTVPTSEEVNFLQALVDSGGYVSQPGFANERVIRSLSPREPDSVTYYVLTRHYSDKGMEHTLAKRQAELYGHVSGESTVVPVTLEEHQIPNWGLERNSAVAFTRIAPSEDTSLLNEYGTSLSFFKYGYTGQTALIRTFPPGTSLDDVRQTLFADKGLDGASIFRNPADGTFVVYGEYFESSPQYANSQLTVASTSGSLSGAELGVVVENYKAR